MTIRSSLLLVCLASAAALTACSSRDEASTPSVDSAPTSDSANLIASVPAGAGSQQALGIAAWRVSRTATGATAIVGEGQDGASRALLSMTFASSGDTTTFDVAVTSPDKGHYAGTIGHDGKAAVADDTLTSAGIAFDVAAAALADVILAQPTPATSTKTASLHIQDGQELLKGTYSTTCMAGTRGENVCSGLTGNFFLSCGGAVLGALSLGRNPLTGLSTDVGRAGAASTALGVPGCISASRQYDSCILYECTCKGSAPLIQSAQQDISNCTIGRRITPQR